MPSKASTRFTVYVEGKARVLISLRATKHGDLIIVLRSDALYRDLGYFTFEPGQTELHGRRLRETRYSVHPSLNSINNINTLKYTSFVEGIDKPITYVSYTRAIKEKKGFAPLFIRRSGKLAADRYLPSRVGGKNVNIGKCDISHYTLFHMALVSHKDVVFDQRRVDFAKVISVTQCVVGEYRVVLLSTYLSLPSHNHSFIGFFSTSHFIGDNQTASGGGIDEFSASSGFLKCSIEGAEEMRELIDREIPNQTGNLKLVLDNATFYKTGYRHSIDDGVHLRRLVAAGWVYE